MDSDLSLYFGSRVAVVFHVERDSTCCGILISVVMQCRATRLGCDVSVPSVTLDSSACSKNAFGLEILWLCFRISHLRWGDRFRLAHALSDLIGVGHDFAHEFWVSYSWLDCDTWTSSLWRVRISTSPSASATAELSQQLECVSGIAVVVQCCVPSR